MSLQLAAQHLASRGRGPDTQLIHMAPQEVAGLQALAKAHGGSLTTNPDTGLPEAGFLSSILPMVAGAGLSLIPGVGPLMAAGIVGGGATLATGSLQKGLMAGLGAYGGAGLAGGLMGAGTGALSSAAGAAAANSVAPAVATEAVAPALLEGASSAAGSAAAPAYDVLSGGFNAFDPGLGAGAVSPINAAEMVTQATPTITQAPVLSQQAADIGNIYAQEQAAQNAVAQKLATASPFDTAKAGLGEVMKRPGDFLTKENLKYGLAGLAPVAMDMMTPKQQAEKEKLKAYEYSYAPGRVEDPQAGYTGAFTGERTYFNPVYTRTAAGGGLMDIGPVESMSRSNQSQMAPAYAQGGVSDMAVNPYTGAEMFAEGGETKAVKPVEQDPYYTMSGQSGDAFKYLMGQMPTTPRAPAPVAAPAPVQSTVQPVAGNTTPKMTDILKPGFMNQMILGSVFGGQLAGQGGQGGEYVDDTSGLIKSYTFDPVTGGFTAAPPPKVFRPYTPAPVYTGDTGMGMAQGGIASLAQGGQSHLGDYSDGGRLLRGPGDGTSDNIPGVIGGKRPARLADGEFVVSADVVSGLGNGSTEAGARKLYAMMDRVRKARTGTEKMGKTVNPDKLIPA